MSGGNFKGWWNAGYRDLIPVVPPDANVSPKSHVAHGKGKSPGIKYASGLWGGFNGWNTHQTTEQDVESWQQMGASVGLRLGGVFSLDLDVYDEPTADMVEQGALEILGPAPMRVGQWPKRLLLYRNDGSITARRLKFAGKQGEVNLIEIPQQAVVDGVHAKTGRPYEWRRPPGKFENLTIVSADALASFLKKMKSILPSAGNVEGASETTVKQETLKGDPDVVAAAMAKMPNTREMRWDYMIRMGYALKAALPDHPDIAFTLWDDWCERWEDDGYDPGAQETRWASLKGPYRAGASWIYEEAEQHGAFDRAEAWFQQIEPSDNPFTEIELNALKAEPAFYPMLSLDDIMNRPAPRWLLARHLPIMGMGFLYSEPGVGKSFVALDVALHIAFGLRDWHGDALDVPDDGVVLYLAAEGSYGFRNRVRAWLKHRGLSGSQSKRFKLIEQTVNFMAAEDVARLLATARGGLGGMRPVLIVVDTVSRAMPGADENLQKEMTLFVGACDRLRDAFGCVVWGVHHAGKNGDMRGSTVLLGAGDFVFRLSRKKGATVGALACEKMKDGPDGWEEPYRFDVVDVGEGQSSWVVERAEMGVGREVELTPAVSASVLGAMRGAWEAGEPWGKTARSKDRYAVRHMVSEHGFGAAGAEEALRMWEASGLIELATADGRNKLVGYKVKADPSSLIGGEDGTPGAGVFG